MAGKRLDLNAPLLSVRRHPSGSIPPPPSSSSVPPFGAAPAVANPGAEDGHRGRRSPLPFYKSDMKSGLVRNAGAVPFSWEQSPGLPKDASGSVLAETVGAPRIAPKPPPGRVPGHLQDGEEVVKIDTFNAADDNVLRRGHPPPVTSCSESLGGSRNTNLKPMVEKALICEAESGSSDGDEEGEDSYSDALDTLSRAESCFMNCSVSGTAVGSRDSSGRVSTDSHARDFMMNRFLPAAQAMAACPSPYAPRKPSASGHAPARWVTGNVEKGRRQGDPLTFKHGGAPFTYKHGSRNALGYPSVHHPLKAASSDYWEEVGNDGGGGDGEECDDACSQLSVKGCGFLPKLCLLNPVPSMKPMGRMPLSAPRSLRPQLRSWHQRSGGGDAENQHSWEEVYRHKLGRVRELLAEETSKLTSESNQLSYWSDSQTADGSSSFRRSTGEEISPYRNDMTLPLPHDDKRLPGVPDCRNHCSDDGNVLKFCDNGGENSGETAPHFSSTHKSGSWSPVIEKNVYVDCFEVFEDRHSKSSFSDTRSENKFMNNDSDALGESRAVGEYLVLKACRDVAAQHELVEDADPNEISFHEKSGEEDHTSDDLKNLESKAQQKVDANASCVLLPPPLPKSPSESWLCRTMPSVASKNSAPLFLGIQGFTKKQVARSSLTNPRRDYEIMVKKSMKPKVQMRFADVLARPASED